MVLSNHLEYPQFLDGFMCAQRQIESPYVQPGSGQNMQTPAQCLGFKWDEVLTKRFILTRGKYDHLFSKGNKKTAEIWKTIIEDMGLVDVLDIKMVRKKWDNLLTFYKRLKHIQMGTDGEKQASKWPYFDLMEEILSNKQNIKSPPLFLDHSNFNVGSVYEIIQEDDISDASSVHTSTAGLSATSSNESIFKQSEKRKGDSEVGSSKRQKLNSIDIMSQSLDCIREQNQFHKESTMNFLQLMSRMVNIFENMINNKKDH